MRFGLLSIKDGLELSEKEFQALLVKSGYLGSTKKAWELYKPTIKKKPRTRKRKKAE